MINVKELAISLAKCEKEEDVITILKKFNIWDNDKCWRFLGDNENNYSTIGNQSSEPEYAFVEKIINSADAILTKKCLLAGIDPASSQAPKTMNDAIEQFLGARDGKISNLDTKTRNKMSFDLRVCATGRNDQPNYTIVDCGEGQSPQNMPNTILSIGKSNKLRIPFVQGKFNMGGTGALTFCGGNHNLQLIISKRCSELKDINDTTSDEYGVTVIRRFPPTEEVRSSSFKYFTNEDRSVMSFKTEEPIEIIPMPEGKYDKFEYGMYIKLFQYQIKSVLKTSLILDFNYKLALLMPSLAHPVRLIECRNYNADSPQSTLSGINVRLADDKRNNLEEEFPVSINLNVDGESISGSIYLFKQDAAVKRYKTNEGIIFTINGQSHGSLNNNFFTRNSVKLSYLQKNLLVILDCTNISPAMKEELIMNSRDRLRETAFKKNIEKSLEEILKNHQGLREKENEWRQNAINKKLNDDKPFVNVLQNLIKNSPSLSRILLQGDKIKNPFNQKSAEKTEKFIGKKHPSYFKLDNKYADGHKKHIPLNNKSFRIQYSTDAINDYFDREVDKGEFVLFCNNEIYPDFSLNLYNGIATLNVNLLKNIRIGDELTFTSKIKDECIVDSFEESFTVIIDKITEKIPGPSGERKKPNKECGHGDGQQPSGLSLPIINSVNKEDWEKYDMDRESALVVISNGLGDYSYDFYINMDNIYLLTEKKYSKNIKDQGKIDLIDARYRYSMAIIGMSAINYCKRIIEEKKEEVDIEEMVRKTTSILSLVLLPTIESMSELSAEDLVKNFDEEDYDSEDIVA